MADAGFFRGTTSEQDSRFANKQKKLMKSMKFEPALEEKVNMDKVNIDVVKPWIQKRITQLLGGIEDEVLIEYIFQLLEESKNPDPKQLQIAITGFLNGKNARMFIGELWKHLLSAQENIGGIPSDFLEKKKEEIRQRKQETERIQASLKKTQSVEADSTSKDIDKARILARNSSRPRRDSPPSPITESELLTTPAMRDQKQIRQSLVGYCGSPAATPVGREKPGWFAEHEKHVEIAKTSSASLLLIGDSIIQGLARYPKIWNKYFTPLKALNFGLGGDRTQNVLWRVENGEIPLNAQTVVIHVGTNNTDRDSPKDIANGIGSIAMMFQEAKPNAKIILTGLLPRDLEPSHRRTLNLKVNKYLKRLCKSGHIRNFFYLKPDADWLQPDGTLNTTYYFQDHLHLVEEGDEKFGKAIHDIISHVYSGNKVDMSSDSEISDDETDKSFRIQPIKSRARSASSSPVRDSKRSRSRSMRRSRSISPRRSRSRSPRKSHSRRRSRSRSLRRYSRSPRRHSRRHSYGRRRRSYSRSFSRSPKRRRRRSYSRSPSPKVVNKNLRELTKVASLSPPPSHSNVPNKLQPNDNEDSDEPVKITPADEGLMREDDESSPQYAKSNKTQTRTYRRKQSESEDSEGDKPIDKKGVSKSPVVNKNEPLSSDPEEHVRRKKRSGLDRKKRSPSGSPPRRDNRHKRRSFSFSPSPKRKRATDRRSGSRSPQRRKRMRKGSSSEEKSTSPEVRKRRLMRRKREEEDRIRKEREREREERERERKKEQIAREREAREREIREKETRDRERKLSQSLREKHRRRQRQQRSPESDSDSGRDKNRSKERRRRMLEEAARRMEESSDSESEKKRKNKSNAQRRDVDNERKVKKQTKVRQTRHGSDDDDSDDKPAIKRSERKRRDSEEVRSHRSKHDETSDESEDESPHRKPVEIKKNKTQQSDDSDGEKRQTRKKGKPGESRKQETSSEDDELETSKSVKRRRRDTEESEPKRERKPVRKEESSSEEEVEEELPDKRRVVLKRSEKKSRSPTKKQSKRVSRSPSPEPRKPARKEESDEEEVKDSQLSSGEEKEEDDLASEDRESSPECERKRRKSSKKKHKKHKSSKSKKRKSKKRRNYSDEDDDDSENSEDECGKEEATDAEQQLRERALKSMKAKAKDSSESSD